MKNLQSLLKKAGLIFSVLAIGVIVQACYPGDSIPISDLDTVTTLYNEDDMANPPKSAALIWEVVPIVDSTDLDNNIPYNGEVDDEILNTTLTELVKLYGEQNVYIIWKDSTTAPRPTPVNSNVTIVTPADPEPNVDALVAPSIILRKKTVAVVYPGYGWWGGWWGGWYPGYPGYPCYYCGYPPTVGYAQYEVGSVVLDLFDLRKLPDTGLPSEDYEPSWLAVMRGLLSSDQNFNSERVVSGIQQAFEQSPYLKPNN